MILEAHWRFLHEDLSRFAGRELSLDEEVHRSALATNERNRSIARLLHGLGRLGCDPIEATHLYTRQCSLAVSARDLAVRRAILADGGVNPLTGERVLDHAVCLGTFAPPRRRAITSAASSPHAFSLTGPRHGPLAWRPV